MVNRGAIAAVVMLAAGCSPVTGDKSAPVVVIGAASTSVAPQTSPDTVAGTTSTTPTSSSTAATSPSRIDENLTAAQLASELNTVEEAAGRGDAGAGLRQQLLYRYLSAHSALDDGVLAALSDDVRPFVERIIRARQFGQQRQPTNPTPAPSLSGPTMPAWTIVDPLPADDLLAIYRDAETATGIAWYWLAAIHLQETRMGRIIGTSSAGAVGPMQFLPSTWARCCTGDATVTRDAIIGAAVYLSQSGGPTDMSAALHVYNPNDSYVATVTAFAENMRDNPQLYGAYHEWQVFYASSAGAIRLPVGYSESQPIDALDYLADHPDDDAG
jgi:membrane-bound lytic murein transglycosylase B